jgi:hypothetical protein
MNLPAKYALFDGGVISQSYAITDLRHYPNARPLYADLGAEAASAGPWVAEADAPILDLVDAITADEALCVGVSILDVSADFSALENHLQWLRFIRSQSAGKKYFFRYADARALSSLWKVLTISQRSALLGPINTWQLINEHVETANITTPKLESTSTVTELPLRLSSAQFRMLMTFSRIGELLTTPIDTFPELKTVPAAQRLELTKKGQRWLSGHRIENDAIRIAVTACCLHTKGMVLTDQAFEQAVMKAQKTRKLHDVLAWYQSS